MRPSRLPHLLRGFSSATVATFIALLSHVAAGGAMPGWIGIAVPLVLSITVSVLLAGRRLSLLRLALAVMTSQLLFHLLFVLGAITPVGVLGHVHGPPAVLPAGDPLGAVFPDAGMWIGHVLAAALTTALLHRGELLLSELLRLSGRIVAWARTLLLRPATFRLAPVPRRTFAVASDRVRVDPGVRALRPIVRRGPPLTSSL
ncbi:hypothetical protein ACFWHT_03735 [Microbacterium sp. NPDC058342]|uniref:hypothetical protein n=1 Tax=Microbacterium sp. NPDC058342 TaxID=3346454 RepID=UPI00364FCB9C